MKADLVGLKEPMKRMFMKNHYDYLVVGAGLTGAVFAHEAALAGKSCLVIDRRDHIAGNIYTEEVDGINVHKYGAHIFHTSLVNVWEYVNRFAEFNNYVNSPVALYKGTTYNMPFNMNTFSKMWDGVVTPAQAKAKIAEQIAAEGIGEPSNLEEQALSLVGRDIFESAGEGLYGKAVGSRLQGPAGVHHQASSRAVSPMTTTTSTTASRAFPWAATLQMVERMLEGVEVRFGRRVQRPSLPSSPGSRTASSTAALLMRSTTSNWARWNTVRFASRARISKREPSGRGRGELHRARHSLDAHHRA